MQTDRSTMTARHFLAMLAALARPDQQLPNYPGRAAFLARSVGRAMPPSQVAARAWRRRKKAQKAQKLARRAQRGR